MNIIFIFLLVVLSTPVYAFSYKQFTIHLNNGNGISTISLPPNVKIKLMATSVDDDVDAGKLVASGNVTIQILNHEGLFPVTVFAKKAIVEYQNIDQKRWEDIATLISMKDLDQKIRIDLMKQDGCREAYCKKMENEQDEIDKNNLINLERIISHYGWPGFKFAGESGEQAAFLILMHADIETQKKYFDLLKNAAKDGNAWPSHFAMLEDRINVLEGRPQVYGTQLTRDREGKVTPYPIDDLKEVNKRRADVGLPPLSEYINQYNDLQSK